MKPRRLVGLVAFGIGLLLVAGCGYHEMPIKELGIREENARITTADTTFHATEYFVSEDTLFAKSGNERFQAPVSQVRKIEEQSSGLPAWSFFLLVPAAVGIAQAMGN